MFIRFTARAFRKLLSIYVFSYCPFGFEGRVWDLIVSVPDHCLSFYFTMIPLNNGICFRLILNILTKHFQKKLFSSLYSCTKQIYIVQISSFDLLPCN